MVTVLVPSVCISLASQANVFISSDDLLSKCRRDLKDNISYYSLFYAGGSTQDLLTEFDQHCVNKCYDIQVVDIMH